MGVLCQIHLIRPHGGVYKPGGVVSGAVKYSIDEDTVFKSITLSLKGRGYVTWDQRYGQVTVSYTGEEEYIAEHRNLLQEKQEKQKKTVGEVSVARGAYESPFEFVLPRDIPQTYKDHNGYIRYYVRLKFERSGVFNFAEKFHTKIPVASYLELAVPDEPTMHAVNKVLTEYFAVKKSVVNLKATLTKLMVAPGEMAVLDFDIRNDSNIDIPLIKTELLRIKTYKADSGKKRVRTKKIDISKIKTDGVSGRSNIQYRVEVPTPPDLTTIQHSRVIKRDFILRVSVKLPLPHRDATLDIPLLLGEGVPDESEAEMRYDTPPPSYWEIMDEIVKEKI